VENRNFPFSFFGIRLFIVLISFLACCFLIGIILIVKAMDKHKSLAAVAAEVVAIRRN